MAVSRTPLWQCPGHLNIVQDTLWQCPGHFVAVSRTLCGSVQDTSTLSRTLVAVSRTPQQCPGHSVAVSLLRDLCGSCVHSIFNPNIHSATPESCLFPNASFLAFLMCLKCLNIVLCVGTDDSVMSQ